MVQQATPGGGKEYIKSSKKLDVDKIKFLFFCDYTMGRTNVTKEWIETLGMKYKQHFHF